jgi:hypothetical protein
MYYIFLQKSLPGVYSVRGEEALVALRPGGKSMPNEQDGAPLSKGLLPKEAKEYLEQHPQLADQLRRAERAYRIFGKYLNLTQNRIIVRESGASTTEVEIGASLLRTDQ